MELWAPALAIVSAYAIGSVSFGLLVAGRAGVDLRAVGSGNTGATNVARALGKREGRWVLALDAVKGLVPTAAVACWLGPESPWTAATAVAAVAGHCWPVWHGFRGGKGAATAAGAITALAWPAGLAAGVTFVLAKTFSRKTSVGSLAGAVVGAATTLALDAVTVRAGAAALIAVLVWVRHADNLRRLSRGEEPDS